MDFAKLMGEGVGAAVGVGLVLIVLGAIFLRRREEGFRLGIGAVAVGLGFFAGAMVFWGWLGFWPGEAWQMVMAESLVLAVLGGLAAWMRQEIRWGLLLVAVGVVTGMTVRGKLTPVGLFLPAMGGAMVVYLLSLRPAVRDLRLWLVGSGVMFVSALGAVVVVMMYVDQNTGRMLILLCAMSGMLIGAGAIRPLRDFGRGGLDVVAMMYAAVVGLAAFYNYGLPNSVFVILACAPVSAGVAWIPSVKKRAWVAVVVSVLLAAGVVGAAVWVAVQNAPAFGE